MFVISALAVFGGSLALAYFVSGMSHKRDKMYLDQIARLRIQCDMMQQKHPAPKPVISRSDDIGLAILKIASDEPQTVHSIQSVLDQSREHISRTVKKMSEQGLLRRIKGRPFKYIITPLGQKRLNGAAKP